MLLTLKGPEKLLSPSAPRSERWSQKKKKKKAPKNLQQESQQLRSVFTRLICFSVSPPGYSLSGLKWAWPLLYKGDVTHVAAPIRHNQIS